MRRFQEAFNLLVEFRSMARGFNTKVIKTTIGDSTKNNRTITVGQTIRFAKKIGEKRAARVIEATFGVLEEEILSRRNFRTDAVDLNELVTVYREVLMKNKNEQFRRKVGTAVSKVG